jgi:hypothetical protein
VFADQVAVFADDVAVFAGWENEFADSPRGLVGPKAPFSTFYGTEGHLRPQKNASYFRARTACTEKIVGSFSSHHVTTPSLSRLACVRHHITATQSGNTKRQGGKREGELGDDAGRMVDQLSGFSRQTKKYDGIRE